MKLQDDNIEKTRIAKYGDKTLPKHCLCYSCGLSHRTVEACGIWWCPNPGCFSSGASWFGRRFRDIENIDTEEYVEALFLEIENMKVDNTDIEIIEAANATLKKYKNELTAKKYGL